MLKRNFLGAHGHLAIGTHFIDRAIAHLEGKGFRMRPDTRNEKEGKLAVGLPGRGDRRVRAAPAADVEYSGS